MSLQNVVRIIIALGALAIVIFVLRDVDLQQALNILLGANLLFLLATLVVQAFTLTARVVRWKFQLYPLQDIPVRTLASPLFISFFVGNVTVTGVGAVPRIYILNRRTGVNESFIAGTIVQEFFLDGSAVALWAFIVPFLVNLPPVFRTLQLALALPLFVLFLVDLAMMRRKSLLVGLLIRLGLWERALSILPEWAKKNVDAFGDGMGMAFSNPRTSWAVIITTVLNWVAEGLIFWLLLLSVAIPFDLLEASAVMAYTNAATGIFIVPGLVGTLEASSIGLVLALGASQADGLAYIVLLRLFFFLPSTLLGAFFAIREGFRLSR